ncbi:hypothetical protein [Tistrella mobilis]|uniref:hypothetical protein n=1 Tax=Tistrella mobilis TaxID=171437 RepID=UPI0035586A91
MKLSIQPQSDVHLSIRRLTLTRDAFADFMAYKKAYRDAYGEDIADEKLAAELVTLALRRDRSLRAYKRRNTAPGEAPAASSGGPAGGGEAVS